MFDLFYKYLQNNDIKISDVDKEAGSFSFTRNGLQYLFTADKNDQFYFRLILPNILRVNETEISDVLSYLNQENMKFKVAKAFIWNKTSVWISVEQFVYSTDRINDFFNRIFVLFELYIEDLRNFKKS